MSQPRSTIALIFCADIAGHRHLYTARLVRYLLSEGVETHVAYAGQLHGIGPTGRGTYIEAAPETHRSLETLQGAQLHDVRNELNQGDDLALIVQLQEKTQADFTVFTDGDLHKDTFLRSALPWGPRLRGKQYAVYVNSEFLYEKRSGLKHWLLMLLRLPWLRLIAKQRQRFVRTYPGLNRWFFRQIVDKKWNERAFCLDENLARTFGDDFFIHTPEFGTRDIDPPIEEHSEDENEQLQSFPLAKYRQFFSEVAPQHRLLMFGDLENRKGFDLLLQLAQRHPEIRLARIGRIKPMYTESQESSAIREELTESGRFFEYSAYINSSTLIAQLLGEVSFLILPYRNYVRASAMMVDAIKAGLPLIVADKGLMAQRVREHGLGLTFPDGNISELDAVYRQFVTQLDTYREPLATYTQSVSQETFHRQLSVLLAN